MRCLIWFACALGACGVTFGAETTPTNLYVSVYGAGDLSGRDWDNATNNLTGAYAVCAAHPGGGTVFLAGGIYRSTGWSATDGNFTEGAAIVPASNVAIVGSGDSDNPTILTGDRDLNDKWATGSVQQWQSGKLVEPGETVYTYPDPRNSNDSLLFSSSEGTVNCRFENLTIHGFTERGCYLANATNVVFDTCRFISIGVNGTHLGAKPLELSDSSAALTNCSFVACRNGAYVSAAKEMPLSVANCLFRACQMAGAYSSNTLLLLKNYVNAVISDSVFRDNCSASTLAISGNDLLKSVSVRNSVFERCTVNGRSATICNLYSGAAFTGCLFVSNSVTSIGSTHTDSASITVQSGGCSLRNCYFGYNRLTREKASTVDATVVAMRNFSGVTLVNCTAESNRVEGSGNACTIGGAWPQTLAMANCVFRNNDCISASGARLKEFRNIRLESDTGNPPTLVNTILWHDADDYIPFGDYKAGDDIAQRMGVVSCDIRNYVPPASAKGKGFFYRPIVDTDPQFGPKTKAVGSRRARRLSAWTPTEVGRKAVKVCEADTGNFYFLDTNVTPNVWRQIASADTAAITLDAGAEIGLDPANPTYANVFGDPRRARASMGPFDTPPSGFKIIAR